MPDSVRVLIADDETLSQQGISQMVSMQGAPFEVIGCVSNGVEALHILQQHPVDILITDIRMPQMDGIELIQQAESADFDIMVIIVSAYDDRAYLTHAIRSPIVYDYINKPFQSSEFGELMRSASLYWNKRREKKLGSEPLSVPELADEIIQCMRGGGAIHALSLFREFWDPMAAEDIQKCAQVACEMLVKIGWSISARSDSLDIFSYINKNIRLLERCKTSQEIGRELEEFIRHNCGEHIGRGRKVTALVASCLDIIKQNLSDKEFGLQQAANQLGVTPNYLSSRFSRDMNMSFTKYLTNMRVEYAKEHLLDVRLKIYQVSDMVGFEDVRYFNKVFKNHEDMSPSEYRNRALR